MQDCLWPSFVFCVHRRMLVFVFGPQVRPFAGKLTCSRSSPSSNTYSRNRRYNVTTCEASSKDVKICARTFSLKLCGNERTGIDGSFEKLRVGNLQTASERCDNLPPCPQSSNAFQRDQKSRPPSIAPPNIPAPRPSIGLAPIPPP